MDATTKINDDHQIKVTFCSLAFCIVFLIVDVGNQIPRTPIAKDLLLFFYITSCAIVMMIFANLIKPILFDGKIFFSIETSRLLNFVSVFFLCLALSINIKTVGDLPLSPYASFLSSFPVVCAVMIFGAISLKNCIKAIALISATMTLTYVSELILVTNTDYELSDQKIHDFLKSDESIRLTYFILLITIVSNIVSILLSASGDSEVKSPNSSGFTRKSQNKASQAHKSAFKSRKQDRNRN